MNANTKLKRFEYRLYPNMEQQKKIAGTFEACDFVFSKTAEYIQEKYRTEQVCPGIRDCIRYLENVLLKQDEWLNESDKSALTAAVRNASVGYRKYYYESGKQPEIKHGDFDSRIYRTDCRDNNIEIDYSGSSKNKKISLPGIGWVKIVLHRPFCGRIKSAIVEHKASDQYYVTLITETAQEAILPAAGKNAQNISPGNRQGAVSDKGHDYEKDIEKYESKAGYLEQLLEQKEKGSNNYDKLVSRIAKYRQKAENIRKYHGITN